MKNSLLFIYALAALTAIPQFANAEIVGSKYRARYKLSDASQKLLDNKGEGFDALYGLRNARAVLNGVYYRGGANNFFNKHKKRANANPLPNEALVNLCKEGFTEAVYLYDKNFSTAKKVTKCRMKDKSENTFNYRQISPLDNPGDLVKLHEMIFEHIRHPRLGPVYDHCWNGWHASGYVAATTLRQFCDFSAEQAVNYWNVNTDGTATAPEFEAIRQRIRDFIPSRDMQLSSEEKAALCPAPDSLAYQPR